MHPAPRRRPPGALPALGAALGLGVALAAGCSPSAPGTSPATLPAAPTAPVEAPPPGPLAPPRLVGLHVSGVGASLTPPSAPTHRVAPGCAALLDPGFAGVCALASGPGGSVLGVVERERLAPGQRAQERDLVWRRSAAGWSLALRRVTSGRTLSTSLWRADPTGRGRPWLVFVQHGPSSRTGRELDLVDEAGTVSLVRQLQGGFAVVPAGGGLVTYLPPAGRRRPWDQLLFRRLGTTWVLESEQPVTAGRARARDSAALVDPRAVPASAPVRSGR